MGSRHTGILHTPWSLSRGYLEREEMEERGDRGEEHCHTHTSRNSNSRIEVIHSHTNHFGSLWPVSKDKVQTPSTECDNMLWFPATPGSEGVSL